MVRWHSAVLGEILQERVVSSRGRRNPRGVKRNISRYPQRDRCDFTRQHSGCHGGVRIIK